MIDFYDFYLRSMKRKEFLKTETKALKTQKNKG